MAFPTGWPPRRPSGRRSIRFYITGSATANYSDNAYLFIDDPGANTFTPIPYVRPGDEKKQVNIGDGAGNPYGTSQRAEDGERFRPNVFQRGFGGSGAEFTRVGTAATGILSGVNPVDGDTVTIDAKTYTFQATLTDVDGNVQLGGTLAASLDNLSSAINLEAGAGTKYANSTTIHPTVSGAASATQLDATAKVVGTAGNSIVTTTAGSGNLTWGGATLSGGTGGTYVDFYVPSPNPLFTSGLVGKTVVITGSTSPANDGTFTITDVPSGRTLRWENTSSVTETFPVTGEYIIRLINEAVPKASIWSGTIKITNKGSNILYYSFDGEEDHGEVQPAGASPTEVVFRNRYEAGIAIRGTASDEFVIEAW